MTETAIPDEPNEKRKKIWGNFRCHRCDCRIPYLWVENLEAWRNDAGVALEAECNAEEAQGRLDAGG